MGIVLRGGRDQQLSKRLSPGLAGFATGSAKPRARRQPLNVIGQRVDQRPTADDEFGPRTIENLWLMQRGLKGNPAASA